MNPAILWFLVLAAVAPTAPALAQSQSAPYAGQQTRAIKSLSDDDTAALLNGEGMGMAKAAELNGYPGPKHVLALAEELKLTENQRQQVQAIFDRMHASAVSVGTDIIERERALDQQFASSEITTARLTDETAKIAELEGRLRSVHLTAHLETRPLLNPEQLAVYQSSRGYGATAVPMHHNHN